MPSYSFTLDGRPVTVDTAGDPGVLYVIRDLLGETGPKYGCGVGVCRACTCHLDGEEIQTCVTPVSFVQNREVTTIQGLTNGDDLHPLQRAWIDFDVAQCGFCQPGQIMTAVAKMRAKGAALDDDDIDEMENICRCGTYFRIRQAIKSVGFVAQTGPAVRRIGGLERTETAVLISQDTFFNGQAGAALLARSDDFPDALTGAALARVANGPVLLTASDNLQDNVRAELARAVPTGRTVYLMGGTAALDDAVMQQVEAAGYRAQRIGGMDRQETASAAAAVTTGSPTRIFIAAGGDFGSAMAAGSTAARTGGVVLLTNPAGLDASGQQYLDQHQGVPVTVVGQEAASTAADLGEVIAGGDVFETAVLLAQAFPQAVRGVALVGAETFADGLAGGAHSAAKGFVVLLTPIDQLPASVDAYLRSTQVRELAIYGGPAAISDAVAQAAVLAMNA